ncbi:MAG: site-specific integrase, partial [Rhizobiales bacterium]|nr:site-specific integrase [Hyphomicrobiales bacterium]
MKSSGKNKRVKGRGGDVLTERFLEMMAAERGASRNTLAAYGRDLGDYEAFLTARGANRRTAGADQVRAFLAEIEARGLARSSAARKLSAVRQFHRFLLGEGVSAGNPTTAVEGPRSARPLPKMISEAVVAKLIGHARARAERARGARAVRAWRLYCLLELLYATGLRVSELVGLTRQAANAEADFITVTGKGGRQRLVPVSSAARQ